MQIPRVSSIYVLDHYEFTPCIQYFILLFYCFPVVSNEVSAFLTSFSHFRRFVIMYFPIRFISFRFCSVMLSCGSHSHSHSTIYHVQTFC